MKNLQKLFICILLLLTANVGCNLPVSDKTETPIIKDEAPPVGSPASRRLAAKNLQNDFAGYEVSYYTEGKYDEILHMDIAGLSEYDKSKIDALVNQYKKKIKHHGFVTLKLSDRKKLIGSYALNE